MDLFAYGTLMCDDILYGVTGCRPAQTAAILANHRRYSVRGELYPGIVAQTGFTVNGMVYFDIPPQAWAHLDRFEGEMYSRCAVLVTNEDGQSIPVITYVVRPEFVHFLTPVDWSYEDFLNSGKKLFFAACFRAHGNYRDPPDRLNWIKSP